MIRFFICSVIGSDSNRLDSIQVAEKYLSSFIDICLESGFKILILDVYDRQK